jgi:hypothetical protein
VGSLNIETISDLKKALKENGYSSSAIEEIVKWYVLEQPSMN